MQIQEIDHPHLTSYLPIIMPTDRGISVTEASEQTGVPPRTIRAWCQDWPGLGRRVGRRDWLIDVSLLKEMAARAAKSGRLTAASLRIQATRPKQNEAPGLGHHVGHDWRDQGLGLLKDMAPVSAVSSDPHSIIAADLTWTVPVAQAAKMLGVSRTTIRQWCESIPGFGYRPNDRGAWGVRYQILVLIGSLRDVRTKRLPRGALQRLLTVATGRYHLLLRSVFLTVRHGPLSADEMEAFRTEMRKPPKLRKRTQPDAATVQSGEVRHGTK